MLEGITRESIGTASAKRLRRDGYLTANIYANGVENIQAAFKKGDFVKAVRAKEELILPLTVDCTEIKTVNQHEEHHHILDEVDTLELQF